MTAWLKRQRQTRTPVDNAQTEQASQKRGELAAYRNTLAAQMSVQLILWATLTAYNLSRQTTWQAATMLALPLAALYALWSAASGGLEANAARYILLALLPCLITDAAVLVSVMDAFMGELNPSYSPMARLTLIGALSLWAALGAGKNGVAYGVSWLRHALLFLFALGTLLLNADASVERLSPLMGAGLGSTALTALSGVGGVWGVALMFALPEISSAEASLEGRKRLKPALWALIPWALCTIWALWLGFVRPWQPDDMLTIGERLMGLARNSRSILVCELVGLGWLLAMPCALLGCVRSGESLITNAFPKLPKLIGTLCILLPGVVYAFFCGKDGLGWIQSLLPYRAALSALAGAGVLICSLKRLGKR